MSRLRIIISPFWRAAVVTLILTTTAVAESKLPKLGSGDSLKTSLAEEYRLGQQLIRQFRGSALFLNDPLVQSYTSHLAHRLLQYSEVQDRRISILMVDSPQINAFAAPGGIIGVFSGLIAFCADEGEIASVLTHEFGHLSQRHYARAQEKAAATSLRNLLLSIGSILIAAQSNSNTGIAAIATTGAVLQQESLRFSRENEREADQVALRTMGRSEEYDPRYVADTFERLGQAYRYASIPPEYLLTHPLPASRITQARTRAAKLPSKARQVNLEYQLIRARVLIHHASTTEKMAGMFSDWHLQPHPIRRYAEAYGRALTLSSIGEHKRARRLMQRLHHEHPQNLSLQYGLAEVELKAGNVSRALDLTELSLRRSPNNLPLMWLQAQALRQSGDTLATLRQLEHISRLDPQTPHVWYQLAETYGLSGDILSVHKARAEYFYLTGRDQRAVEHLRYAQQLARDNFTESERILARKEQIMSEAKKNTRR